jgi:hypothetical protein
MLRHLTLKFVWVTVLLSPIAGAGGGAAFAAQGANNDVRVCNYKAGKIVSSKGPLRVTVSPDGVTAVSGGKTALLPRDPAPRSPLRPKAAL